MAIEARGEWLSWNDAISKSKPSDLPATISPEDRLLDICGVYHLAEGKSKKLPLYTENLASMEKGSPHLRELQFIKVLLVPKEVEMELH